MNRQPGDCGRRSLRACALHSSGERGGRHILGPLLALSSALCVVLLTPLATAQQVTPTDGIRLPDASIATQGDAAGLEVNPAGLAFIKGAEIGYGFELATEDLRGVADEAQSYFLAGGLGWLGAGVSAQWLQKPSLGGDLQSYRKFTFGTGVKLSRLGVGVGLNWFGSSDDERLDDLMALDVGFQLRASEHLGIGLMMRDLNTPFIRENIALPARVELAAALRFWDGRIVLEQAAQTNLRDRYLGLTPRLSIEPVLGLRAFARSEFSLLRIGDTFQWNWDGIFAGLELSLGVLGAQYAAMTRRYQAGENPRFAGLSAYHWISPGKKAPLVRPTKRWIWIDLDTTISEEPTSGLFGTSSREFLSLVRELDRIAESDEVDGVVVGISENQMGYAQIWEFRQRLQRIGAAGKQTIAILGDSSLPQYYLASAAREVWYVPTDVFSPSGVRSRFLSFREAFDKVGVEAQFVRIGDYKSTPEMLLYDQPTPPNVEQREAYLDSVWNQIVTDISSARGKTPGEVVELLSSPHFPPEAVEKGLVDALVYGDEVETKLRERDSNIQLERGFSVPVYPDQAWGRGAEVAVVAVDGNIVRGTTTSAPLFGDAVAGSESLARVFEKLRTDSSVRAVVVRIDSPGGSAVASDLIYRSIRNLARHKPVVASMGNSATSGGYYVAAGADEIFAAPMTTTGSIGIFAGKVNVARLSDRLGVHTTTIERGSPSTFSDLWTPWDEREIENLSQSLNYMYRLFLTQVEQTRPLELQEIDDLARGRVWIGSAAAEHRLVDQVGGLMDAVRRAEQLAGMEAGTAEVRQYASAGQSLLSVGGIGAKALVLVGLDPERPRPALFSSSTMVGRLIGELKRALLVPLLYDEGEPLMLPDVLVDLR